MYFHYTAALNIFKVNNRSNLSQMFFKIAILKNFANFTGKDLYRSLFLIKLQTFCCPWYHQKILGFLTISAWIEGMQLCYKETPTVVFSCEIWEIFKSTFFYRTPPAAASVTKNNQQNRRFGSLLLDIKATCLLGNFSLSLSINSLLPELINFPVSCH